MDKKILLTATILAVFSMFILSSCGGGNKKNTNDGLTTTFIGSFSSDLVSAAGSGTIKISAPDGNLGTISTNVDTSRSYSFEIKGLRTGDGQTLIITFPNKDKYTYTATFKPNVKTTTVISLNDLVPINKSKWSMFIYIAGDNSLSSQALTDLKEMTAANFSTDDLQVIVFYDNKAAGANIYKINGDGTYTLMFVLNEPDSGLHETAANFFTCAKEIAPGSKYIAEFWDHGSGWDTDYDVRNNEFSSKSIAIDDNTKNAIRLIDLKDALHTFFIGNNAPLSGKIDIVFTDACLMGSIEVACELENSASYLVASPDQTPVTGANYISLLTEIGDNASSSAKNMAILMEKNYTQSIKNARWQPAATAYDLNYANDFAMALNIYITAQPKKLSGYYDYDSTKKGNSIYRFDVPGKSMMYDLIEFIGNDFDSYISDDFNNFVISAGYLRSPDESFNGLPYRTVGIFFPNNGTFSVGNKEYEAYRWLKFSKLAPAWYTHLLNIRN